ncbi:MAG: hypothetical protein L0Z62_36045 [Gemmataceae bacterium]|nr:hypothetical protein [Gemmataceae bacterium]
MAAKKKPKPAVVHPPPTIHEATLAPGPSGAVLKGTEIDLATAIARRQAGQDVVVCGNNLKANRALARKIESAVGEAKRQEPHKTAGPDSLPHFQQADPPPKGHTFYETENRQRKARKQP